MRLNLRHLTQGGQVAFMRLRMFLQINNLISYYMIMSFMVITLVTLFIRVSTQNSINGLMYWYAWSIHPLLKNSVNPTRYTLNYYGKKLSYTTDQIINDAYTSYCGQLLKQELIISALISMIVVFLAALFFYCYLGRTGRKQSEDEITGGRVLNNDPKAVARLMRKRGQASDIKIDHLPIKKDSETQNFGLHGTVGSGKSTLIRKFLSLLRERGDLVIIYDKGCTFIDKYYDESKDILLNPLDKRCANWDMWEECQTLPDLETVSNTLIPMGSSEDPFWQGSARTIFAEAAQRMRQDKGRSYNKFLRTLLAIKLDKLREFLAGTPASALVDSKIEKTAISIRSVLTNYVKAMRYLQGIERSGQPKFTIRQWMQGVKDGGKNGWLFVTSNQNHHESLKPVISMWLGIAANSLLSMGENRQRRVWFFIDELPSLHKLPSLPYIIAEARKFGGCFALGFQSYPQLEEIYGSKFAESMFDLLNTKYFFRSPSAQVAKFVEEDIGETVKKKFSEQTSFGAEQVRDGISFGKDEQRVNIVSYTDVQMLEDLECFVTLPGHYPVVRMSLKYQKLANVAEPLVLRNVESSLDPHVESELEQRSEEASKALDLLFSHENSAPQKYTAKAKSTTRPTATDSTTAGGGREDPLAMKPIPNIGECGDIRDDARDGQYTQPLQTRKSTRKEEVNINLRRVDHEMDEPGGYF